MPLAWKARPQEPLPVVGSGSGAFTLGAPEHGIDPDKALLDTLQSRRDPPHPDVQWEGSPRSHPPHLDKEECALKNEQK